MEVEGEDGKAILVLEDATKTQLGRSATLASHDPTVSRRQLVLQLQESHDEGKEKRSPRAYAEVTGPNPICILRSGSSFEILKKGEQASLGVGDKFSLSVKDPHFFTLKLHQLNQDERKDIEEAVARRQKRAMERKHNLKSNGDVGLDVDIPQLEELNMDSIDLSKIDPVAEFGFLVEGSEFEQFGKRGVQDVAQWEWSLGKESEKSSDDEDIVGGRKSSSLKWKSKKKKEEKCGQGDRDWRGESDEEKEQLNKLKVGKRPTTYKTRSKSSTRDANSTVSERAVSKQNQVYDSIDDDDETLGGFIVDDDAETTDEGEEDELSDDDFDEDENDDDMEDEVIDENTKRQRKPLCKFGNNCYRKSKEHLKEFRHE